jgi:hypothetical protein
LIDEPSKPGSVSATSPEFRHRRLPVRRGEAERAQAPGVDVR